MDEQVQSLRLERARARGHRRGHLWGFHVAFLGFWIVAGGLLAGTIWLLTALLKTSFQVNFLMLWLSMGVAVFFLTLPRFVDGSRQVRMKAKRAEMQEWVMEGEEDLLAAGFTSEQIERGLAQADPNEVAKLLGTLHGLKQASRRDVGEKRWHETVVSCASPLLGQPERVAPHESVLATRVTYSPGKYSQLKLNDGSRFLVEVLNDALTVRKLKFATIPEELIWRFDLGTSVRTTFSTSEHAKEMLDIVLESIMQCQSYDELRQQLHNYTDLELLNYIEAKNRRQVIEEHNESMKQIRDDLQKSGFNLDEETKKLSEEIDRVLSSEEYQQDLRRLITLFIGNYGGEAMGIEVEDANILGDFGDFLEDNSKYVFGYREDLLPHAKSRIADAFIRGMILEDDPEQLAVLKNAYPYLAMAFPEPHGTNAMKLVDDGIGSISPEEFEAITSMAKTNFDVYNEMRAADICRRALKVRRS